MPAPPLLILSLWIVSLVMDWSLRQTSIKRCASKFLHHIRTLTYLHWRHQSYIRLRTWKQRSLRVI